MYSYKDLEVYPGTLEERSIERIEEGKASEVRIAYDITLGGPLVEEFVDPEYRIDDFTKKNGREIYYLLRRVIISRGRIHDPIPNPELERIAIDEGFWRLDARIAIRDAWKMRVARRFIRGKFVWGLDQSKRRGRSFGVHYILRGSSDTNQR
jgi:hypothetical protein